MQPLQAQPEASSASPTRERVANVLFLLGAVLLFCAHACLTACWVHAWQNGVWPFGPFDTGYRGGPWASRDPADFLENFSGFAALLSVLALLPSVLSVVARPGGRSGWLLCVSFINFLVLPLFVVIVSED